MNNKLEKSIDVAMNDFQLLNNDLSLKLNQTHTLKQTSIDFFKKTDKWIMKLKKIKDLIPIYNTAFENLEKLNSQNLNINKKGEIFYLDGYKPFSIVRFLLTQSYLNISWTIIDVLSAVVGEILFPEELVKNPSKPIRLVEYFFDKEKGLKHLGTNLYTHIKENYGWPIILFYFIRNHFIHEGIGNDEFDIFESTSPHSNVFIIKSIIKDNIITKSKEKHRSNIDEENSRCDNSVWIKDDLFIWLKQCAMEIDDLLYILLNYSKNIIISQAKLFLERDMI